MGFFGNAKRKISEVAEARRKRQEANWDRDAIREQKRKKYLEAKLSAEKVQAKRERIANAGKSDNAKRYSYILGGGSVAGESDRLFAALTGVAAAPKKKKRRKVKRRRVRYYYE